MRLTYVEVKHFRGIKHLEWKIDSPFICLVGPGDSRKTTILDAISYALSPQRYLAFDDTDFYDVDLTSPIKILVTVANPPTELITADKFGPMIRGVGVTDDQVHDEPEGSDIPALTIRLRIDHTLEPAWTVINDRTEPGKTISGYDRGYLSAVRLGNYSANQLSWGPGTALSQLLESPEKYRHILADARRKARSAIDSSDLPNLKKTALKAQEIAKNLGVSAVSGYRPGLDARNVAATSAVLALYDGQVPMRQAGLGTSRLLTIALQHEAVRLGGVTLIDEIEEGLEPHRLRRLLHVLQTGKPIVVEPTSDGHDTGTQPRSADQVVASTHSPIVIMELEPENVGLVRNEKGVVVVRTPPNRLRRLLRANPGAFLARKVIVCEGKTELGFMRAFDAHWGMSGEPMSYRGTVLADGGGSSAPGISSELAQLEYGVAFLGDSDTPLNPTIPQMKAKGIAVYIWDGCYSIEERIAIDLGWAAFIKMIKLAIEIKDASYIKRCIAGELNCSFDEMPADLSDWSGSRYSQDEIRSAFARAAKSSVDVVNGKERSGWFKRVDYGYELGRMVIADWEAVKSKPTGVLMNHVKGWIYD